MIATGQLKRSWRGSGDGTAKDRSRAGRISLTALAALCLAGLTGPAAAAAVQQPAGVLFAWGNDDNGQVGGGSGNFDATPVHLTLPAGTAVTAVAAGFYSSLALTSDGRVLAWGSDYDGQLGVGGGNRGSDPTPSPVELPAGTDVTAIASGYFHCLALTSDGRVLAWGDDSRGEIGDGSTTDITHPVSVPVPVDLPAGTRVTAVAGGGNLSLALTADGRVLAWGDNSVGQLGNGTTADSSLPVPVNLPPGTDVTAIAAGDDFSLAVTSDGRVFAWGGDYRANDYLPTRVDLPAGTRVTSVAAGFGGALAVTSGGRVLELGSGPFGGSPVAGLPACVRITGVSINGLHILAVGVQAPATETGARDPAAGRTGHPI